MCGCVKHVSGIGTAPNHICKQKSVQMLLMWLMWLMWSMLLNVVDVVLVVNVLIMNDAVLIIFLFPPMAVAAVALDVEIAL